MAPSKAFLPKTYDTEMGGKKSVKEKEEDDDQNLSGPNQ
jgi:hypothetical protein